MILRPLKKGEIKEVSKIVGVNYSKDYQKKSFAEMEAMFKNHVAKPSYIVAESKGKVLGFAGYIQSWMDYNIYQIFWVNVSPEYQGEGVGTALVKNVIERIRKKKDAKIILLTTDKPDFYAKKFCFKTLNKFNCGEEEEEEYELMFLSLTI